MGSLWNGESAGNASAGLESGTEPSLAVLCALVHTLPVRHPEGRLRYNERAVAWLEVNSLDGAPES